MSTAAGTNDDRSQTSTEYILRPEEGRQNEEVHRLNTQHLLFSRLFENRLVFGNLQLKPGDNILDSATGTGAWAFEMASHVPNGVTIDAIDIDPRLFSLATSSVPPSEPITLPFNFHQGSALAFPTSWDNRFTLVNQRLLVGAFTVSQWKANISELHRITAPQGWVQLLEAVIMPPEEELARRPHLRVCSTMLLRLWDSFGLVNDGPKLLRGLLRDSGFEEVKWEERRIPIGSWAGVDGVQGAENWARTYIAMEGPFLRLGLVESGDELKRRITAVRKEWDDVPGFYMPLGMVYGKKAGERELAG